MIHDFNIQNISYEFLDFVILPKLKKSPFKEGKFKRPYEIKRHIVELNLGPYMGKN